MRSKMLANSMKYMNNPKQLRLTDICFHAIARNQINPNWPANTKKSPVCFGNLFNAETGLYIRRWPTCRQNTSPPAILHSNKSVHSITALSSTLTPDTVIVKCPENMLEPNGFLYLMCMWVCIYTFSLVGSWLDVDVFYESELTLIHIMSLATLYLKIYLVAFVCNKDLSNTFFWFNNYASLGRYVSKH